MGDERQGKGDDDCEGSALGQTESNKVTMSHGLSLACKRASSKQCKI